MLNRRRVVQIGLANAFPFCLGSAAARPAGLSWSPDTRLGLNIIYTSFWNDGEGRVPVLAPQQYEVLRRFGVSYVRNLVNVYAPGGGVTTAKGGAPGAHFAVRNAFSCRPFADNSSELEIVCDGSTYAISPGETIVLSKPLPCIVPRDRTLVVPPHTPIKVTGGTAGKVTSSYATLSESTVRIAKTDALVAGAPPGDAMDCKLLHNNFYLSGRTPRGQVALYVDAAAEWMKAGFCFDHGGKHDFFWDLVTSFGLEIVNRLFTQELDFYAALSWDPRRVLISSMNELTWAPGGKQRTSSYEAYFRDVLFPRMRHFFPRHTLGFGTGTYDFARDLRDMTWWPSDRNTLLLLHAYLDVDAGGAPVRTTGTDPDEVSAMMDWVSTHQKRLGVPQVYWQEFGLQNNPETRSVRLANFRLAAIRRGWFAAPWGADVPVDSHRVAVKREGVWLPAADSLGAFGLD